MFGGKQSDSGRGCKPHLKMTHKKENRTRWPFIAQTVSTSWKLVHTGNSCIFVVVPASSFCNTSYNVKLSICFPCPFTLAFWSGVLPAWMGQLTFQSLQSIGEMERFHSSLYGAYTEVSLCTYIHTQEYLMVCQCMTVATPALQSCTFQA